MATITTRAGKGSPLTNDEVDANFTNLNTDKAELSGANFTGAVDVDGNITTTGTVDGRDIASDGTKLDGVESGATADQTDAEIRAAVEAATDSNVFTDADHTKLDGIEASADVTDTANVTAAGALMDSEVTNLAQVKAFDSSDYATAAQGSTADSALQNVVEDTTPQLGGDLASNGNDILFADNDKAIFGAGSDLQIYHDTLNSVIADAGTGNLIISADDFRLQNASQTANMISANDDGAVTLTFSGGNKLATTSTGIDVTGTAVTDGLTSAVTDGSSFAANFNHTGGSVGRNGIKITSSGTSGTSTLIEALRNTTNTVFKVDGSGNLILNDQSGNQNHILNVTGAAVFNDQGVDGDFRVESNNNANMLFVDGGANKVGIGVVPVEGALTIKSAGNTYATSALVLEDTDSTTRSYITHVNGDLAISNNGSTDQLVINAAGEATFNDLINIGGDSLNFTKADGVRINAKESLVAVIDSDNNDSGRVFQVQTGADQVLMTLAEDSGAVFNEGSADLDFRVESNNNANMIFVDAGADHVNIGTATDFGGVLNVNGGAVFDDATTFDPDTLGSGRIAIGQINDGGGFSAPGIAWGGVNGNNAAVVSTGGVLYLGVGDRVGASNMDSAMELKHTEVSVNNVGIDMDFRVESDSNTHALFVDAGNSHVNINTSTDLGSVLNISTGSSSSEDFDAITVKNGGENGCNLNFDNAFGTMVQIKGTKQAGGGLADEGRIDITTAVNGTLTGGVRLQAGGTSWAAISDERLKNIIEPITNAAQKVSTLRAVIGNYKADSKKTRRPFLIAQDIQAVLPEAVDDSDENDLGLRYTEVIPLLVAAIKEQQTTIETLEARITALENT